MKNSTQHSPYIMPQGFSIDALMANAIERQRLIRRRILWARGAFAAAASVAAVVALSLYLTPSPAEDYDNAIAEYLENASEADISARQAMADADIIDHLSTYDEYFD